MANAHGNAAYCPWLCARRGANLLRATRDTLLGCLWLIWTRAAAAATRAGQSQVVRVLYVGFGLENKPFWLGYLSRVARHQPALLYMLNLLYLLYPI